jgi:hypothetical protein
MDLNMQEKMYQSYTHESMTHPFHNHEVDIATKQPQWRNTYEVKNLYIDINSTNDSSKKYGQ